MLERRKHPRMRTLKGGKVECNRRLTVIDCVVRNMSAGGACLQTESSGWLPAEFDLLVPIDRLKRRCRVAWRGPDRLGAVYIEPNDG